jgi:AraC-like DNA-binding protein
MERRRDSGRLAPLSLRRRDAVLRSVLERQADEIIARLPQDRSGVKDVRRALESRMGRSETGIREVARHLAMSPRTLQGRLESEGSSYQAVLEEWRKEAARGWPACASRGRSPRRQGNRRSTLQRTLARTESEER